MIFGLKSNSLSSYLSIIQTLSIPALKMSVSVADIMSVSIVKVINTKVNTYIHDFTERLCAKYNLEESEVLQMWSEVMPDLKIKEKKTPSKSKTKAIDPSQIGCCKHIPDAGKFKGIECGKRCIGDWCPSHAPEKLEKAKAKREAKKAEKKSSDKADKKESQKDESDSDSEEEKPKKKTKAKKTSDKKAKKKSSSRSNQAESDDDTSDVSDSDSD
jgi:type IV secretory pathway VirB10-like protein